jgi:hypothetical protein
MKTRQTAATATTQTETQTRATAGYAVRLTEKGAQYVAEQRIAAKLAVAAEMLKLAGDPLANDEQRDTERYEREARASGAGWRDAWRSYANLGGNDADRGW